MKVLMPCLLSYALVSFPIVCTSLFIQRAGYYGGSGNSTHGFAYFNICPAYMIRSGSSLNSPSSAPNSHKELLNTTVRPRRRSQPAAMAEKSQETKFGSKFLGDMTSDSYRRILTALLESAADCSVKDNSGKTALFYAIEKGRKDLVFLLLEAGEADVNAKDEEGLTALHNAAEKGDTDIVTMLLEAGADVRAKDQFGRTPLNYASYYSKDDVVIMLIEAGAYPNSKGVNGETPLHDAVKRGNAKLTTVLLEAGADYSVKDDYGKTPLHYAAAVGEEGKPSELNETKSTSSRLLSFLSADTTVIALYIALCVTLILALKLTGTLPHQ